MCISNVQLQIAGWVGNKEQWNIHLLVAGKVIVQGSAVRLQTKPITIMTMQQLPPEIRQSKEGMNVWNTPSPMT